MNPDEPNPQSHMDVTLAGIGKAWCDFTGYDNYPPASGDRARQWIAFKAGFVASKEKIEGEKLTFLKRQLIEATAQLDSLKAARDKAIALIVSYGRQDDECGAEFEGVDATTNVIRILKAHRDELLAALMKMCAAFSHPYKIDREEAIAEARALISKHAPLIAS